MQKIKSTALIAIVPLIVCTLGCTDIEPEKPEEPEKERSEVTIIVEGHIVRLRDEFDAIPGKTGILAEKPLYSVVAEELIIRDYFQDRRDGFFVDVGCAWPVDYSNTYYLEKNLGWTGIGIDALDDYAADWAKMRPTSKFRNYLVTSKTGGEGTFFKSNSLGLSSTNEALSKGKIFGADVAPEEIKVPMMTLSDILDREGVTKIDLLSMDIEGHEPEAFKGFDIDRFAPELLVIEGQNKWVEKYLAAHGYRQIERYLRYDQLNRYYERTQTTALAQ